MLQQMRRLPKWVAFVLLLPLSATFVVWGIADIFKGSTDTSLATVAPGIAESLAATAFGLAAAIPASVGYNRIGAAFARLGQEMASFVEERALALLARPAEVARDDAPRRRAETP